MTVKLPRLFQNADMKNVDPDQFEPVHDYAKNFRKRTKGILLSGPPGVGKSYAIAALTRFVEKRWRASNTLARFDCVFVTAPEFFDNIPIASTPDSVDTYRGGQHWIRTYCTVPWLVINDLGKELRQGGLGDQVVYKLGRVLRARAEAGLVYTHVTTNLVLAGNEPGCFGDTYGPSILSLSRELFTAIEVTGEDRRRMKHGT